MSADNPVLTANLQLQELGVSHVLQPDGYNKLLGIVDGALPPVLDTSVFTALGTGVAAPTISAVPVRRMRLTLTALRVLVADADAFGGTALFTWPNRNLTVINARANLIGTKDGTGIIAAATPTVAVGSAVASNATLSGAMIDTVDAVALAGTLAAAYQKNGPATHALRQIVAGASNKLFLNAAVNPASDGFIDFTGTIDVDYIDLGNFS